MTALHSQPYKDVIERVIARRLELGWSQEELARRLPRYAKPSGEAPARDEGGAEATGQLQSFVSKFEQRQRRLDVIEFMHLCHALGLRLCEVLAEHDWAGEPPPTLVPLARESLLEERPLALRRARPGRGSGETPSLARPQPWPAPAPMHGASRTDPARDADIAADAPESGSDASAQAMRRAGRRPTSRKAGGGS